MAEYHQVDPDKIPTFQMFFTTPADLWLGKSKKIQKVNEEFLELEKMNKFGIFNTNNNFYQIMEEYIKLEIHKYKKNISRSESLKQLKSKIVVPFGGQVKLGYDENKKKKEAND